MQLLSFYLLTKKSKEHLKMIIKYLYDEYPR